MLLIETNLEPLFIRAQETLAVFLMKMAAGIQTATATNIKRFVIEGYSTNLKLSRTLRRALTKSSEKFSARMVNIPPLPSRPPWFLVPCNFVVNTPQKNSDESPHVLKSIAMAEAERLAVEFPRAVQIYTDGSLDPEMGLAGASAIIPVAGISHEAQISDFASTVTTELVGIELALKASGGSDRVVHTDSLNAIRKIADRDPQNSLVVSIQALLVDREHNGNSTTLHWEPSHVGIPSNEKADRAALKAAKVAVINRVCPNSTSQ
jgi:ribonuclease HI